MRGAINVHGLRWRHIGEEGMSIPEYKDGQYVASWDFQCPACGDLWNNDGDPYHEGEQYSEECPGCGVGLIITASYYVDYEVELDKPNEASDGK